MSNKGKYVDRNPNIQTAGKIFESLGTVGDSLKIYSSEEAAYNIKLKCKKQTRNIKKAINLSHFLFLPTESLKDILSPESKKSRFVAFKEKFSEDMFFKKAELGKAQSLQSKPVGYNNENFTYGVKNASSESVHNLIFPQKTPQQIKQEFLNGTISHNHYMPSEKIKRNYNESFNPQATFGISNKIDVTGQMVKKCLQYCERSVVINEIQKIFLDRTQGQLDVKIDRYNLNLDPMRTFGKPTFCSTYNVRALIENIEPCIKKAKIIEALSHVNKLRRFLFNRSDFHIYDLKLLLNKYDKSGTGFITFKSIMKSLHSLRIYANEEKLRLAIEYFNIIKDQQDKSTEEFVSLEEFWKILHMQYPLPHIGILSEIPVESESKETTYRLLCKDRNKPLDNKISFPIESSKQNNDHRITVGDVITPDIPMHFGLIPSDFELLRPKEELRHIFHRLLSEENFKKVWEFGWSKKCTEAIYKMSVNELRAIMKEYNEQNTK